jgi:hypothetical protein
VAAAEQVPALPRVFLQLLPEHRAHKLPGPVDEGAVPGDEAAALRKQRRLREQLLQWISPVTGLPLLPKTGLNVCRPIHRVPALSPAAVVDEAAVVVALELVDEAADQPFRLLLLLLRILAALMLPAAACALRPD